MSDYLPALEKKTRQPINASVVCLHGLGAYPMEHAINVVEVGDISRCLCHCLMEDG